MTDDTYTYKTYPDPDEISTFQISGIDEYHYTFETHDRCKYQNSAGWAFRQYGWICPKCGRVWAPWVPSCDCVRRGKE